MLPGDWGRGDVAGARRLKNRRIGRSQGLTQRPTIAQTCFFHGSPHSRRTAVRSLRRFLTQHSSSVTLRKHFAREARWFAAPECSMTQFLISAEQMHSSDFYLLTVRNSFTCQIWTFWLPFRNHFVLTGSTFSLRLEEEVIIHTQMKAANSEGFRLPLLV